MIGVWLARRRHARVLRDPIVADVFAALVQLAAAPPRMRRACALAATVGCDGRTVRVAIARLIAVGLLQPVWHYADIRTAPRRS